MYSITPILYVGNLVISRVVTPSGVALHIRSKITGDTVAVETLQISRVLGELLISDWSGTK